VRALFVATQVLGSGTLATGLAARISSRRSEGPGPLTITNRP